MTGQSTHAVVPFITSGIRDIWQATCEHGLALIAKTACASFVLLGWPVWSAFLHRLHGGPPGPLPLPIVGNLMLLWKWTDQQKFLEYLHSKYGDAVTVWLGWSSVVVIRDASTCQKLLRDDVLAPHDMSGKRKFAFTFPHALIASVGAEWAAKRPVVHPPLLTPGGLNGLMKGGFGPLCRQTIACLEQHAMKSPQRMVEIEDVLEWATDLAFRMTHANLFGMQEIKEGFGQATAMIIGKGFEVGAWSGWQQRFLVPGRVAEYKRDREAFFQEFMRPCMKKPMPGLLCSIIQEAGWKSTDVETQMLDFFDAGTDSSSRMLTAALQYLVLNPSALKKAQAEVDVAYTSGKLTDQCSMEDLQGLTFLRGVVLETLRLQPPFQNPAIRCTTRRASIGMYTLPRGQNLFLSLLGAQRNHFKDESFCPERWTKVGGTSFLAIPEGVFAFIRGPRMCPGRGAAIAEMVYMLALVIQAFDIKISNPSIDWVQEVGALDALQFGDQNVHPSEPIKMSLYLKPK